MAQPTLTPREFAQKWGDNATKEKAASQEHFIDLAKFEWLFPYTRAKRMPIRAPPFDCPSVARSSWRLAVSMDHRRSLSLGVASIWLVASAVSVAAAEPGAGVAFLDDSELKVTVEAGATKNVQVWLVNGGPLSAELSLRVISAQGPEGAPPVALKNVVADDAIVATSEGPIGKGTTWTPVLTMTGDAPAGTYTGKLVGISGDGSHVSRDITVIVVGKKVDNATSSVSGDVFSEPYPDPLTVHGERSAMAVFQGGQLVEPVTLKLDPNDVTTISISPLIDDRGRLAIGSIGEDGTMSIISTPAAGTYKGTLSKADADGKPLKLTSVSLTARDFFLWPLAVLILGLALAFGIENWFTKGAPRRALKARLTELQEQSTELAADSAKDIQKLPDWAGDNRHPVTLFKPTPPGGVLEQARIDALKDFDETPSPTKRDDRWGGQGTELAKVRGYVDSQRELGDLATWANQAYFELLKALGAQAEAFKGSPLGSDARKTLGGGLLDSVPGLQKKVESRRDISARLDKASELAKILVRLQSKLPPKAPEQSEIAALRVQLSDMPRGTQEEISAIATAANLLWNRVIATPKYRALVEEEAGTEDYDTIAAAFESFFGVDTGGGPGDAVAIEPTSKELRSSLERSNLLFLIATGVLIVAAPFGTLYLANPAFGSESDYVALLVWSFTAAAVVQMLKYAASMIRLSGFTSHSDGGQSPESFDSF